MAERSGLDYAAEGVTQKGEASGKDTPIAHTCGHDFHIVCLLGAVQALRTHREHWRGAFIAVFQPGEENAAGAKAMVADGIVDKMPRPYVYLGQHVLGRLGDRFGHVRRESGRVTFHRPIIWAVEAGVATIGHAHARAPVTTKPGTGRALLGTNRGTGAAGSHRAVRR